MTRILTAPQIVLGIPAYNDERYIEECLASVQRQTFTDFSVLISDDASTDRTSSICQRFAETDPRFVYVRQPATLGGIANFRFLLDATSSPFFAWVGDHDMLKPDYVQTHVEILRQNPVLGISFTYLEVIDEHGTHLRTERDQGTASRSEAGIVRYLWSAAIGAELGPFEGVMRRDFIPPLAFRACPAWDHVFLSNMSYRAPFHEHREPLYVIRHFDESRRRRNVMQRNMGRDDATVDPRDNIRAFLADFDQMVPRDSWHRYLRPLLFLALWDRFGRPPYRMTRLLRSVAKRIHGIKRFVGRIRRSSPR
jgi:glycosyltransferase involved in cell wall biosynthesis